MSSSVKSLPGGDAEGDAELLLYEGEGRDDGGSANRSRTCTAGRSESR